MTRETKIGLLVGLAFIIVIGILLSDHLTSSTEPPQAPLANAGNSVRQTVTSPGTAAAPISQVPVPTNTAPQQPLATQNELTPGPDPAAIVKIGPGNSTPSSVVVNVNPASNTTTSAQPQSEQPVQNETDAPMITKVPAQAHPIDSVARQHGEELVLIDANGRAVKGVASARGGAGEYVAQAGDTLSKIASKFMGANTKANRDAIVAANPSLKGNPDKIIVGRTYVIPTATAPTAAAAPAASGPPAPAAAGTTAENWYTVKPGDSLWKIASEQCGRGSAVAAIKELNKDILRGDDHDQVIAGMRIKLPNKVVAQSN